MHFNVQQLASGDARVCVTVNINKTSNIKSRHSVHMVHCTTLLLIQNYYFTPASIIINNTSNKPGAIIFLRLAELAVLVLGGTLPLF